MEIILDNLQGPEILALLEEHLSDMYATSPPESVHALDTDALRHNSICLWSLWLDGALAGCGALKELDSTHGEIKSMRTSRQFHRRGVAATLLAHIITVARERGYRQLSLETGAEDYFAAARSLYSKFGFKPCPPFAGYTEDPNSVFMNLKLTDQS